MNNVIPKNIVLSIIASFAASISAYEINTHALITDHAYRSSTLNPQVENTIVEAIGFDRLHEDRPFSFRDAPDVVHYYDDAPVVDPVDNAPTDQLSWSREPQQQERNVLDSLVNLDYLSGISGQNIEQMVHAWLIRGAVREDDNDYKVFWGWRTKDDRDHDPHGRLFRAFRHFYDPFIGRASDHEELCEEYGCVPAIDWALGRTSSLNPPTDADDTFRRNHFSWQDARNNYWWALSLDRNTTGVHVADAIVSSYERLQRWATTIKSLGHVIHLLQDVAQPQHVRNDLHGPPLVSLVYHSEGAADGAFEAYTDYRVVGSYHRAIGSASNFFGNPLRHMRDDTLPSENALAAIRFGSQEYYPGAGSRVQFSTPVKFFTTRHLDTECGVEALSRRRGLADFANRSFFTAGTLPGAREIPPPNPPDGCSLGDKQLYPLPPGNVGTSGYVEVSIPSGLRVHGRVVRLAEYAFPVTDPVAPHYDESTRTLAAYGGKAPLLTKGIWHDIVPDDLGAQFLEATGYLITYNNMRYAADVLLPRAVGYSAGLIDFFFRGRLEVAPIDQSVFAVMNQGEPHTMDEYGYPRHSKEPTRIFGFESVRLRVRNVTADIVESGTGEVIPQATGGDGARLVAIARYHRNACYRPDLSGERAQTFDGIITEPECSSSLPVRTNYQEISVSAPLSVVAGELDGSEFVEKQFDFSLDPIPVNATDLFIQVAYRGPLGDEADGIAVGMYDVSEPTFAAAWNNTDYFWHGTNWVPYNTAHPMRPVYSYWACAGVPSRFVYSYSGTAGSGAMQFPPDPGAVRLAFIFGVPINPYQRFAVRSVPLMLSSPHAPQRSGFTRGQVRQANKEVVSADTLAFPFAGCFLAPPYSAEYWCFDPIKRRRGVAQGEIAQPIYYETGGGSEVVDVDSVPLPEWATTIVRDGGENRFNVPGALQGCPSQPTSTVEEQELQDWIEELELHGAY